MGGLRWKERENENVNDSEGYGRGGGADRATVKSENVNLDQRTNASLMTLTSGRYASLS